jgi:hypothetical protein
VKYKEDWEEAQGRLCALWRHEGGDRPYLAVTAPSGRTVSPCGPPRTPEEKWMDPDWIAANRRAALEGRWCGGEAIPSYLLMGGWTVSLGGSPLFAMNTIWFETAAPDFDSPSPYRYDAADPWVCRHRDLYEAAAVAAGQDDFLVGGGCLLPANDLLSMHMGTELFLTALVDHPEWMRAAIIQGARDQLKARVELRELIRDRHRFWYGIAGWMPFWAPEPFVSTQSDVSCMLSPDMYDEFVVPELDVYGEAIGAMWYHLDGCDARQHLPRLLSLPYVRVVQYTPTPSEAPNGPEHLAMYRQIQEAGRIVHVQLPRENVEPLARALDPALLLMQTECGSVAEGEALLRGASRW